MISSVASLRIKSSQFVCQSVKCLITSLITVDKQIKEECQRWIACRRESASRSATKSSIVTSMSWKLYSPDLHCDVLWTVEVSPFGTRLCRNVRDSFTPLGESIDKRACAASSRVPAVSHTSAATTKQLVIIERAFSDIGTIVGNWIATTDLRWN